MKSILATLLILAACSMQGQTAAPADVQALGYGVYYKTEHGWQPVQSVSTSGGGAKHVGKMLVPVVGPMLTPQMVMTFRDAQAPVQITDKRPTFLVKQSQMTPAFSPRSIVIVRFDTKKNHRELQTTNGGNAFTYKGGFSHERTPEIVITAVSEDTFTVAPKDDLTVGEYLITFSSMGVSGWDFGIKQGI